MRKILIMFLLLLLATTGYAISMTGFITLLKESNYIPPEENLIIVETTPEGIPIEKRMAQEADLLFSRTLRVKAIFLTTGITGYENELIINLKNVSKRKLENITLIETIPKGIVENVEGIVSDQNFTVLEKDPIIKFNIPELNVNETTKISYSIQKESIVSEVDFKNIPIPTALIKLEEEGSCIGVYCNDFNPCTTDLCEEGECVFKNKVGGTNCGGDMVCEAGECVPSPEPPTELPAEGPPKQREEVVDYTILAGAVIVLILLILGYFWVKKRK